MWATLTPLELEQYALVCRKYGIRSLDVQGVKLEMGNAAPQPTQDAPKTIPAARRPLTNEEALFAATEGFPEEDEPD